MCNFYFFIFAFPKPFRFGFDFVIFILPQIPKKVKSLEKNSFLSVMGCFFRKHMLYLYIRNKRNERKPSNESEECRAASGGNPRHDPK